LLEQFLGVIGVFEVPVPVVVTGVGSDLIRHPKTDHRKVNVKRLHITIGDR
jgi:hypothetical protein